MTILKSKKKGKVFEREFGFSKSEFRYLSNLVFDHTGIHLQDKKYEMVYARLARRIRALNLQSFSDYCQLLDGENGDKEIGDFINSITTNLTKFFRDPEQFSHFRHQLIKPKVVLGRAGKKQSLKVWSAGCSTGEEAYSIAMAIKASKPKNQQWTVRILATDIDTNVLKKAKNGGYKNKKLDDLPPKLIKDFLNLSDDKLTLNVDAELKEYITFRELNLMNPWPMKQKFNAIFCKNVMIYFDTKTRNTLIERFVEMLEPGGFLYLGHSETLLGSHKYLERDGHSIYKKL
jgi:chemotaxis protein methyltransferase CheR